MVQCYLRVVERVLLALTPQTLVSLTHPWQVLGE